MPNQPVVILHSQFSPQPCREEALAIEQTDMIAEVLRKSGFYVKKIAFSFEIVKIIEELRQINPQFVFNLVEEVEGSGSFLHLAPALLDYLNIQYTGCSTEASFLTTNKIVAKKILTAHQIATPEWLSEEADGPIASLERYIVKPISEDGSSSIDENAVVSIQDVGELRRILRLAEIKSGKKNFAERYIDGREFYIGMLGRQDAPHILPAVELKYFGFEAANKPKVRSYPAKWDAQSFEYQNTEINLDFAPQDRPATEEMQRIARKCWSIFALKGYASVDFRVDRSGKPWVLEINTNPYLHADVSSFVAAAYKDNIPFEEIIQQIVSAI